MAGGHDLFGDLCRAKYITCVIVILANSPFSSRGKAVLPDTHVHLHIDVVFLFQEFCMVQAETAHAEQMADEEFE